MVHKFSIWFTCHNLLNGKLTEKNYKEAKTTNVYIKNKNGPFYHDLFKQRFICCYLIVWLWVKLMAKTSYTHLRQKPFDIMRQFLRHRFCCQQRNGYGFCIIFWVYLRWMWKRCPALARRNACRLNSHQTFIIFTSRHFFD